MCKGIVIIRKRPFGEWEQRGAVLAAEIRHFHSEKHGNMTKCELLGLGRRQKGEARKELGTA